jgi:hypothetical protein
MLTERSYKEKSGTVMHSVKEAFVVNKFALKMFIKNGVPKGEQCHPNMGQSHTHT